MSKDDRHRIEIMYPMTTHGENLRVHLRIIDGPSGEILFDAEMDPAIWLRALTSTVMRVDGFVTKHPERIGKKMVCEMRTFPMRDGDFRKGDDTVPKWLDAEVAMLMAGDGWHEADKPRRNNQRQWEIVLRKWE